MEVFTKIDKKIRTFIEAQKMFFVATAPLSGEGHVNLSPKGLDSLRVLSETRVAYLDLTGSGAETIAHLKENGRITIMLCAFEGPPNILRLFGTGTAHPVGTPGFEKLAGEFGSLQGARSIIEVDLTRVQTSCGYAVPFYEFKGEREQLTKWAAKKGEGGIAKYQQQNNRKSIDGLPALD